MSALARALLAELGPEELAVLAERLQPFLRGAGVPVPAAASDGWMTTKQAAEYLGISVHALHRLTAAREIPFSQAGPGARCFFKKSDLDEWRV
jgi:excisionase family DNA binding protein